MFLDVRPYTIAEFRHLLSASIPVPATVDERVHLLYFQEYFDEVGARTIVVESPYVDHDYLDDFASYYVRCFHPYERVCTRLHFFTNTFDAAALEGLLRGERGLTTTELQRGYTGFVVVRPLPRSVIGRTCLLPYGSDGGRRHFPTSVKCRANLYGVELSLDTVPFQEQDRVTAACATSALWSCFQSTGASLRHRPPSPVEITRSATLNMPLRSRVLPSEGLTLHEMANAVRAVGLEPYHVATPNALLLQNVVNAYVAGGIPGILILEHCEAVTLARIGHHGAAITGFSRPQGPPVRDASGGCFAASRINKLYVHDDQVGPHARMEFVTNGTSWSLSTSWGLNSARNIVARPSGVLIPLPEKVRLPYHCPRDICSNLSRIFEALKLTDPAAPLEWDMRLQTSNAFKGEVMSSTHLAPAERVQHLSACLPRYVWRATGRVQDDVLVELIADATDIDSGRFIRALQFLDPGWEAAIHLARASAGSTGAKLQRIFAKIDDAGPLPAPVLLGNRP